MDGFHPQGQVMSLYLCRGHLSWAALKSAANFCVLQVVHREGTKVVHVHGSWLIRYQGHFINPSSQMSHILWVLSLPKRQENELNQQRVGKGGQRTDYMPPNSISSLHFSNSFPHGGMPGMWVVRKAFKNTPGDENALRLKASLLAKRRCIEGSWLPPLLDFWDVPDLLDEILLA